ncbi:MAG: T9SS type A sorting domain-containing protein [bacterium]|nr:T9SS type A sorting domain-containing protein [bacterium]
MIKKYLIILIILTGTNLFASAPDTLWTRTFGGTSSDYGLSVQQTYDSGFIVVGSTSSFGASYSDVYLIKMNSSGDTLWTKTLGGDSVEGGYSVQQVFDSGLVIAGYTRSFGAGNADVYLIKTNSLGDTLWTRTYGGTNYDYGYSVQQTYDSGLIIAGYTYSFGTGNGAAYLIKTNSLGDTLWTRTYGGTNYYYGYSVVQCEDRGFIIAGDYLIRTDSLGDTLWTTPIWGSSVVQCNDGGFVTTQKTSDVVLTKTNSSGNNLWIKTYGGVENDYGQSVAKCTDEGFIIAGTTGSFGSKDSSIYLVRTNPSGDTLWTEIFGKNDLNFGYSAVQCADEGFIVLGNTVSPGNYQDIYLIRLNKEVAVEEPSSRNSSNPHSAFQNLKLEVSQNPFSKSTVISFSVGNRHACSLRIYNIAGKLVKSFPITQLPNSPMTTVTWDGTDNNANKLKSGIYFVKLTSGNTKLTKKLILMK